MGPSCRIEKIEEDYSNVITRLCFDIKQKYGKEFAQKFQIKIPVNYKSKDKKYHYLMILLLKLLKQYKTQKIVTLLKHHFYKYKTQTIIRDPDHYFPATTTTMLRKKTCLFIYA